VTLPFDGNRCSTGGIGWPDDTGFVGNHDGLDPVAQTKFHQDSGHVGLDGVLRHEKRRGYLGVGLAAGE